MAQPALAQPRLGDRDEIARRRDGRGRLSGPLRVGGDEHVGAQRGHERRDFVGLDPSEVVQRRVGLALEAALGVPRRPPMTQQDDPAAGHSAAAGTPAGVNGMNGQSFHSFSRL